MKMTVRSEYALLALVFLAQQEKDTYTNVKTISKIQKIPPKFLEQILLAMKHGGYVASVKGQQGGYRIAKPANKITVGEVIRLFDGALAPTESVSKYFYRATPIRNEKKLMSLFKTIRDFVSDTLEKTTIADVM
ncbi:Rrf2 family transcriptional regulator [Bdellovibrionota bacterium FG-1]